MTVVIITIGACMIFIFEDDVKFNAGLMLVTGAASSWTSMGKIKQSSNENTPNTDNATDINNVEVQNNINEINEMNV